MTEDLATTQVFGATTSVTAPHPSALQASFAPAANPSANHLSNSNFNPFSEMQPRSGTQEPTRSASVPRQREGQAG